MRIDVRLVHADLLPPIGTEPAKPHRVYSRNSVELVQGLSRDPTEQCRTRIIQAMSSDADLSAREAAERGGLSGNELQTNRATLC